MRIPFFNTDLTASQVSPAYAALQAAPKYYTALQTAAVSHQTALQQRQATAQALQATHQAQILTQSRANDLSYQREFLHQSLAQQTAQTGIVGAKAAVAPTVEGGAAASAVGAGQVSLGAGGQAAAQQLAITGQQQATAGILGAKKDFAPALQKAIADKEAAVAKQMGIKADKLPEIIKSNIRAQTLTALSQVLRDRIALAADKHLRRGVLGLAVHTTLSPQGTPYPGGRILGGVLGQNADSSPDPIRSRIDRVMGITPPSSGGDNVFSVGRQTFYRTGGETFVKDSKMKSGYRRVG